MMSAQRRLVVVWAAIASLTLAAIPISHVHDAQGLGVVLTAALLVISFMKASLVLGDYLDLRHAPPWNKGLRAAVFILLAILGVLAYAARLT